MVVMRKYWDYISWTAWDLLTSHSEGTTGRALTFELHSVPASEMTVARCIAGCEEHGFELAGVEFSAECCK